MIVINYNENDIHFDEIIDMQLFGDVLVLKGILKNLGIGNSTIITFYMNLYSLRSVECDKTSNDDAEKICDIKSKFLFDRKK